MVILRRYSFVTDGQFAMESVAGIAWNRWPECYGISGRNGVEYTARAGIIEGTAIVSISLRLTTYLPTLNLPLMF